MNKFIIWIVLSCNRPLKYDEIYKYLPIYLLLLWDQIHLILFTGAPFIIGSSVHYIFHWTHADAVTIPSENPKNIKVFILPVLRELLF